MSKLKTILAQSCLFVMVLAVQTAGPGSPVIDPSSAVAIRPISATCPTCGNHLPLVSPVRLAG